jgi:rRNA maturation endonuclease Nob1
MGPWASAVIAVASLVAVFFMVMGFRGLIEAVDNFSGRCITCARTTLLPLPAQRHECWRCHYALLRHPLARRASVRHLHTG